MVAIDAISTSSVNVVAAGDPVSRMAVSPAFFGMPEVAAQVLGDPPDDDDQLVALL
jgi:hypothetical protein